MVDMHTQKPFLVQQYGRSGPFVGVPYSQIVEIRQVLDAHQFNYWLSNRIISINREPEFIFIKFHHKE